MRHIKKYNKPIRFVIYFITIIPKLSMSTVNYIINEHLYRFALKCDENLKKINTNETRIKNFKSHYFFRNKKKVYVLTNIL